MIENVVRQLHKHGRRASYGSLTTVLGMQKGAYQAIGNLMAKRPRNHLNSWVVAKRTGLPSGYDPNEIDPRLPKSGPIIITPADLISWLKAHP